MTYSPPYQDAYFDGGLLRKISYFLLSLAFLSSGVVFFEPAPFDLLILASILLFLISGLLIPSQMKWIVLISFIHLVGSFLGVLVSERFADSNLHIWVTAYMFLFSIGIIILIYNEPNKALKYIMHAYVVAALVTALLGIIGYFNIAGTGEMFTRFGRAKGAFKDPNVFGPFLVTPMLYLMDRVIYAKASRKIFPLALFSILLLALLLSFSRGAWGLFLVTSLIYFISAYASSPTNRFRVELSIYILLAIIFLCVALIIAMNTPKIASLLEQRATLTQSYDVGEGGRFSHYYDAFKLMTEYPFGIGAKEFGWIKGEDVHNTYLTMFMIGGWIGGATFIFAVLYTAVKGAGYCFYDHPLRRFYVIFYASFVGLCLEAMIIDIDHWRQLYVVIGVVWGIIFFIEYNDKKSLVRDYDDRYRLD